MSTFPTNRELANYMKEAGTVNGSEAEKLRKFLFDVNEKLGEVTDLISVDSEEDFVEDPEDLLNKLCNIRDVVGGLLGIATTLARRLKYLSLTRMLSEAPKIGDDGKPIKIPQADREFLARGEVADLEGLLVHLKSQGETIDHKIYMTRASLKSGRF